MRLHLHRVIEPVFDRLVHWTGPRFEFIQARPIVANLRDPENG